MYSEEEQKSVPSTQPHIESDETKVEPLTVIEQSEVITPQPTANQAMKGTVVLLLLGYAVKIIRENKMHI